VQHYRGDGRQDDDPASRSQQDQPAAHVPAGQARQSTLAAKPPARLLVMNPAFMLTGTPPLHIDGPRCSRVHATGSEVARIDPARAAESAQ
jgi:hypothetical protein